MYDMQRLHECRDNRDAHYQDRRFRSRTVRMKSDEIFVRNGVFENADADLEEEMLEHVSELRSKTPKRQRGFKLSEEQDAVLRELSLSCLSSVQAYPEQQHTFVANFR